MYHKNSFPTTRKINDNLPEVDFSVSTQGVTIYSDRFTEPRFLEFDIKGKCPKCKSNSTEIDYFINESGIEIESTRFIAPKFVFFDLPHRLPNQCHFRVRMKGQNYIIPFENVEIKTDISSSEQLENSLNNVQQQTTKIIMVQNETKELEAKFQPEEKLQQVQSSQIIPPLTTTTTIDEPITNNNNNNIIIIEDTKNVENIDSNPKMEQ